MILLLIDTYIEKIKERGAKITEELEKLDRQEQSGTKRVSVEKK